MVGAALNFDGGLLGIECCEDGKGERYLRAIIYSNSQGRQVSAPVDTDKVIMFARSVLKTAALAKGLDDDKLIESALVQMVDEIRAAGGCG